MSKQYILFCIFFANLGSAIAQNKTDVSLFMRNDSSVYLDKIAALTGDLFYDVGHHGPAIENEWLGLRVYFDKKATIDVYSKKQQELELKQTKWYPTAEQQKNGWGADYYKVGNTIGLGGVRLWDGEKVVPLNPVSCRTARVVKEANFSFMEMLSENIPFAGDCVDVLFRVTVYSGIREAKVEAFALTSKKICFVTGINFHQEQEVINNRNNIIVWGLHPEDVAIENVELGAAILFDSENFEQKVKDKNQFLLISKPTKYLSWKITSANAREAELNTLKEFADYVSQKE